MQLRMCLLRQQLVFSHIHGQLHIPDLFQWLVLACNYSFAAIPNEAYQMQIISETEQLASVRAKELLTV